METVYVQRRNYRPDRCGGFGWRRVKHTVCQSKLPVGCLSGHNGSGQFRGQISMGWRKRLHRAKRLHRPSLKNWECDGLYEDFPEFLSTLVDEPCEFNKTRNKEVPSNIPALLDARTLSADEFWDEFEGRNIPCIMENIPNGYDGGHYVGEWPARTKWALDALEESPLRERVFKCGEDDDGNSIKVKLKYFLRYLKKNRDDSPLYIFDSSFERDKLAKSLLNDYRVPSYFSDDLFRLVSEARRPPYRWVLIGPERSGSTVHIDPLATNAWNTLLFGKKRWVLFPPHIPKSIVKGRGLIRSDEDDEAAHYFMTILPRIKRKAFELRNTDEYRDFCCYEFTQHAGETVFVPHDWWHAVLNLTDTVGVTQNFCSPRNFRAVWAKTRNSRKRMAWKFLCQLKKHYPELAAIAEDMNRRDGFRMKYDPKEMKRKESRSGEHSKNKVQRTV